MCGVGIGLGLGLELGSGDGAGVRVNQDDTLPQLVWRCLRRRDLDVFDRVLAELLAHHEQRGKL